MRLFYCTGTCRTPRGGIGRGDHFSVGCNGDPIICELQLANGIEALDSGDSSLALRLLADYLARYPSSDLAPNARYLAARAALEEKEPLKALAWLTDLDRLIPEVEDFVLAAKATAHRHLGQWPETLSAWELLLKKYPKSPLS